MSTTVTASVRRDNRGRRFDALEWCRDNVKRAGQRSCMFAINGGVTLGATAAGAVHSKGVKRCASPWACPVCAPTIAERRAGEIDAAVLDWWGKGGTVYMVTATLSHKYGDDLAALLDMLQGSWSRLWRWEAPHYSTRAKTLGQITNADRVRPDWYGGQIRTVEITYGDNGWHPHIHALVFMPAGCDEAGALRAMRHRWLQSVEKFGGTTDVRQRKLDSGRITSTGWDVRPVNDSAGIAGYVTKVEGGWSAGREIAKADQKRHGVTPWALLEHAVAGDLRAVALFKVYERATRGLRRIVASPGFKLVEDVEAAEARLNEPLVVMVQLRGDQWRRLLRSRQAAALLSDISDLATGALKDWAWPAAWLIGCAIAA